MSFWSGSKGKIKCWPWALHRWVLSVHPLVLGTATGTLPASRNCFAPAVSRCILQRFPATVDVGGKSQVIDPSCVGHPRVSPAHSLRRPDACGDGGQCRVRCACGCLATSLDKPTIRETPPHTGDSRSACGRAVSETQVHGGIHPFKTVVAAPPVLCP